MILGNLEEVTAMDLRGPNFDANAIYVVLERSENSKPVRITLNELKKWITADISSNLAEVSRRANVGYMHGQKLGPVRRGIY